MPKKSFQKVFEDNRPETIDLVSSILRPKSAEISREFYSHMLESDEAKLYLENELVEKQLSKSFDQWANDLFCTSGEFDSEVLGNYHLMIGRIHARIGIPMRLVDFGMQVVKDFCFRSYLSAVENYEDVPDAIIYINNILDTALTTINQSYFDKTLDNERNAQLLRLKMASSDLNIECERVKSDLMAWSRDLLSHILSKSKKSFLAISNVYNTNFGLWINHKAVFYFSDYEELSKIKGSLIRLDEICANGQGVVATSNQDDVVKFMNELNDAVNEVGWLLTQIIERNIKENQSKDPLTNMLSRRYLDNVLKREEEISLKQKQRFSILMIDLDHFKHINDTYGHSAGDDVLKNIASIIMQCIRPTDFSFRYGGEEIVVVLTSMNENTTFLKAENIRRSIENSSFIDREGRQIPVTASIGAAIHDGHPDYQKTLDAADKQLYAAKGNGRNVVQI